MATVLQTTQEVTYASPARTPTTSNVETTTLSYESIIHNASYDFQNKIGSNPNEHITHTVTYVSKNTFCQKNRLYTGV